MVDIVMGMLGTFAALMFVVAAHYRSSADLWRLRAERLDETLHVEVARVLAAGEALADERSRRVEAQVERDAHGRMVQTLNRELARHQALVAEKDELIVHLKREGFAPPQDAEVPAPFVEKLPEEVLVALDQIAPEGTRLRTSLLAEAEEMYERDVAAEEIAASITAGSDLNPHHL